MLFHKDIGFPKNFREPSFTVGLEWGRHAERECMKDRYGLIEPFGRIDLGETRTVEVEMSGGRVVKLVQRGSWDFNHDFSIVLIPNPGKAWFVKTIWLNRKEDTHRTLDRSRYSVPA